MCPDRILELSDGRLRPILSRPIFSTAALPWAGFLIEEGIATTDAIQRQAVAQPTIYVCNQGQGTVYWKHRGEQAKYHCVTGSVCIANPSYELEHPRVSNPWQFLALALDTAKFRYHAPAEARAIETSLVPLRFAEDATIFSLLTTMHAEAKAGCPSGRLYAESLSLALLAYLTGHYTDRQHEAGRVQLSPAHKRRVLELIRENLDAELAVSDLAAAIGLSSAHFSRLFKASFAMSPHRFITGERVAKAKQLLTKRHWSVAYIGAELGFSSHSHFTKVFHSFVGVTPTQFRHGR